MNEGSSKVAKDSASVWRLSAKVMMVLRAAEGGDATKVKPASRCWEYEEKRLWWMERNNKREERTGGGMHVMKGQRKGPSNVKEGKEEEVGGRGRATARVGNSARLDQLQPSVPGWRHHYSTSAKVAFW